MPATPMPGAYGHLKNRHSHQAKPTSAGFTLVELMIALFIVAVLAAVAVPALTRDDISAKFTRFSRQFAQHVVKARMEANSSSDDRQIFIAGDGNSYQLDSVYIDPGSGTATLTKMLRVRFPEGISIVATIDKTTTPGISYTSFPGPGGLPANIRFTRVGEVEHDINQPFGPGSATVYLQAEVDGEIRHRARVVINQSTGYSRLYEAW